MSSSSRVTPQIVSRETLDSLTLAVSRLRSLPPGRLSRRKKESFKESFREDYSGALVNGNAQLAAEAEAVLVGVRVDPAGCAALCAGDPVRAESGPDGVPDAIDGDDMTFLRDELEVLEISGSAWDGHRLPLGALGDDGTSGDIDHGAVKDDGGENGESEAATTTTTTDQCGRIDLSSFPSLLVLRVLGVHLTRLPGATSPVLRSNLRVLALESVVESTGDLVPSEGSSWPALGVLSVTGCALVSVTGGDLMTARRLPSLVHLDLSWNSLPRLPDLSGLPSLASVSLAHNEIESMEGCHRMLGNIERLDMSSNRLSTTLHLERLPSLKFLLLSHNTGIRGRDDIVRVGELPVMRSIDVRGCGVGADAGLSRFVAEGVIVIGDPPVSSVTPQRKKRRHKTQVKIASIADSPSKRKNEATAETGDGGFYAETVGSAERGKTGVTAEDNEGQGGPANSGEDDGGYRTLSVDEIVAGITAHRPSGESSGDTHTDGCGDTATTASRSNRSSVVEELPLDEPHRPVSPTTASRTRSALGITDTGKTNDSAAIGRLSNASSSSSSSSSNSNSSSNTNTNSDSGAEGIGHREAGEGKGDGGGSGNNPGWVGEDHMAKIERLKEEGGVHWLRVLDGVQVIDTEGADSDAENDGGEGTVVVGGGVGQDQLGNAVGDGDEGDDGGKTAAGDYGDPVSRGSVLLDTPTPQLDQLDRMDVDRSGGGASGGHLSGGGPIVHEPLPNNAPSHEYFIETFNTLGLAERRMVSVIPPFIYELDPVTGVETVRRSMRQLRRVCGGEERGRYDHRGSSDTSVSEESTGGAETPHSRLVDLTFSSAGTVLEVRWRMESVEEAKEMIGLLRDWCGLSSSATASASASNGNQQQQQQQSQGIDAQGVPLSGPLDGSDGTSCGGASDAEFPTAGSESDRRSKVSNGGGGGGELGKGIMHGSGMDGEPKERLVVACMQCSGQFERGWGEPPVKNCRICGSTFVVETREPLQSGRPSDTSRPSAVNPRIAIDGYSSSPVRPSPLSRAGSDADGFKMMLVGAQPPSSVSAQSSSSSSISTISSSNNNGVSSQQGVQAARVDPMSQMPSYLASPSMGKFLRACAVVDAGEEPACWFHVGCSSAAVSSSSSSSSSSSIVTGGAGVENPVAIMATAKTLFVLDYPCLKNAYRSVSVAGLVLGKWAFAGGDGGAVRVRVWIGLAFQWFRLQVEEQRASDASPRETAFVMYVRDRARACGILETLSRILGSALAVESADMPCIEMLSHRLGVTGDPEQEAKGILAYSMAFVTHESLQAAHRDQRCYLVTTKQGSNGATGGGVGSSSIASFGGGSTGTSNANNASGGGLSGIGGHPCHTLPLRRIKGAGRVAAVSLAVTARNLYLFEEDLSNWTPSTTSSFSSSSGSSFAPFLCVPLTDLTSASADSVHQNRLRLWFDNPLGGGNAGQDQAPLGNSGSPLPPRNAGQGRPLFWDLVVGSGTEERSRVVTGLSRAWEEIFKLPLVVRSEGWSITSTTAAERGNGSSGFGNQGPGTEDTCDGADDSDDEDAVGIGNGQSGGQHRNRARQSLAKGPLPPPRLGSTVPADLRLSRSLDSSLRSGVLRDGPSERPLLGGEMVVQGPMGERLVTLAVTNTRVYLLDVRRTGAAQAAALGANDDHQATGLDPNLHIELVATHRLSDLRRIVTGLGYQTMRLEFAPTASGTVPLPGLGGMILAPGDDASGSGQGKRRSSRGADTLPPMYPYLFLVRDRVYLTRFLACLVDQLQSLAPSGHVVDIIERYDDEMTDRVVSLLDAHEAQISRRSNNNNSSNNNNNNNNSNSNNNRDSNNDSFENALSFEDSLSMLDGDPSGNDPNSSIDGSPLTIHRGGVSKNSTNGNGSSAGAGGVSKYGISPGGAPGSPGLFRRPPSHLRLYLLVLKVTRREDGVERTLPRALAMRGKSVHLVEDYETMWLPWGLTAVRGGSMEIQTERISDVTWMSVGDMAPNRVSVAFEHEPRPEQSVRVGEYSQWDLIIPCPKGRARFIAEVTRLYKETMLVDLPIRSGN